VPLWKEDPRRILLHEISHIFLHQQLSPARIPRWFHEGYALYCSQMWDLGNSLDFSIAILVGAISPLESLNSNFPADETLASRAYLQSYTVVNYMFGRWRQDQLALLFERWRTLGELDPALRMSLGLTLAQLENRWREWAETRYGWLKLITSVTVIWIFAAGLFVALYITRRVKYHQRLKEMKASEPEQDDEEDYDPSGFTGTQDQTEH